VAATVTENVDGLFEPVKPLPDNDARRRLASLVGLDEVKRQLVREAEVLLDPTILERWSKTAHGGEVIAAVEAFSERIPLFVFAGDVGTGKTALAESIGDAIARELDGLEVLLYPLSLRARGSGSVGEMTQLISSAFDRVRKEIPARRKGQRPDSAAILLIDEADALAQSRALAQMHHEDRAGVNALIRGVDGIATERRPILTIMCTNRLDALDPAVRRRAARVIEFHRPNDAQRRAVLDAALKGTGLTGGQLDQLVSLTGPQEARSYGLTYSDLRMRLIPDAVLSALPDQPLTFERLAGIARELIATPPFGESSG
jgi:AAA+ superfamily predicted ATPase